MSIKVIVKKQDMQSKYENAGKYRDFLASQLSIEAGSVGVAYNGANDEYILTFQEGTQSAIDAAVVELKKFKLTKEESSKELAKKQSYELRLQELEARLTALES